MDHNSLIDKNTYDVTIHAEDNNNVFICDKPIANAISKLNKKGYKTIASCSGHYKIEYYEYLDEDIKYLEEYQKDDRIIIKKIKDKTFDFWQEVDKTHMYILFDKVYYFKDLPNDFIINNDKTCIDSLISFYDKNNNHKTIKEVMKEIDKKCKLLEEWVDKLPDINERNDKNE